MVGLISAISSRKRVPPSASSKSPRLFSLAPVNAPFLCPNNSLSSKCSPRLPQKIGINALSLRDEWLCKARATSSLPVPLSPSIKTEAEVSATSRINSRIRKMGSLFPIISGNASFMDICRFNFLFSDCNCPNKRAFCKAIVA